MFVHQNHRLRKVSYVLPMTNRFSDAQHHNNVPIYIFHMSTDHDRHIRDIVEPVTIFRPIFKIYSMETHILLFGNDLRYSPTSLLRCKVHIRKNHYYAAIDIERLLCFCKSIDKIRKNQKNGCEFNQSTWPYFDANNLDLYKWKCIRCDESNVRTRPAEHKSVFRFFCEIIQSKLRPKN